MSKPNQLVVNLLNELHEKEFKITFESLNVLLDYLETKNDPSQTELQIVNSIYQFVEKVKILEASLRIYTQHSSSELFGNKLAKLYENESMFTSM